MDGAPQRDEAESSRPARDESGFSLIEVVVALVLIGVVAAGALMFFVRGVQSTSHLQRTQAASSIATQGMELVRSVNPRVSGLTSGLVIGRSQADVMAVWNDADPELVADSRPAWDDYTPSDTPTIPFVEVTTFSDITYEVVTLIGSCWRDATASEDADDCVPDEFPHAVKMYRVTVVVEWPESGAETCDDGRCNYSISALIDPSTDASWNLSTDPIAYDDEGSWPADGEEYYMDILSNDVLSTVTSNPTLRVMEPAHGSYEILTANGDTMGSVNYTTPTDYSGPVEFSYKLRDAQGRNSEPAVVRIAVTPHARADSATVPQGESVTISVLDNDGGSSLVPVITSHPTRGTATAVGSNVVFSTTGTTDRGSVSFAYAARDALGQESLAATVTVTITDPLPVIEATDYTIDIPATTERHTTSVPLRIQEKLGFDSTYRIVVVSSLAAAEGTLASTLGTMSSSQTSPSYTPRRDTLGIYTFTFRLQDAAGNESEIRTGTIRVVPVANDYEHDDEVDEGDTESIRPIEDNAPDEQYAGVTYLLVEDSLACNIATNHIDEEGSVSVSDADRGRFNFTSPEYGSGPQERECTFDYQISWTQGSQTYTTPAATVTVEVDR